MKFRRNRWLTKFAYVATKVKSEAHNTAYYFLTNNNDLIQTSCTPCQWTVFDPVDRYAQAFDTWLQCKEDRMLRTKGYECHLTIHVSSVKSFLSHAWVRYGFLQLKSGYLNSESEVSLKMKGLVSSLFINVTSLLIKFRGMHTDVLS